MATIDRIQKNLFALGWGHPFWLPGAARLKFVADLETPTLSVDDRGVVRYSETFLGQISDQELQGCLAHEIAHVQLRHQERRGARIHPRWNRAADRAINGALRQAGLQLPSGCLYPEPGQEALSAEELYEIEPGQPQDGQGGKAKIGQGCGCDHAGGEEEDPGAAQEWREVTAQAKSLARNYGEGKGSGIFRLFEPPAKRVRWQDLLRASISRAVAAHGVDDKSWTRRSRRSCPDGVILPGGVARRVKVAVVIDSSGSMDDTALAQCVTETCAIVAHAGIPAYLVVHDDDVQTQGWIQPGVRQETVSKRVIGRGGTSFNAAYEAVARAGAFDAVVHLTDGCVGSWPARPVRSRQLVVGLLGEYKSAASVPPGARVVEVEIE